MIKNKYYFLSSIVAALGGLLFGFDTAVIAGVTKDLTSIFSLTPNSLGFTISIALWGTIIGALFSSYFAEKLGRRDSLKITGLLFLVSALGCAFSFNWISLLVFRFIGGLGVGASSVIGPLYISEIAPADKRGRLVGMFQFNIVFGILVAYFSNYLITLMNLGMLEWRFKLGIEALPALVFFIALFFIPYSPRWLLKKGNEKEAFAVLNLINKTTANEELKVIKASIDEIQKDEKLFKKRYAFPIFLAVSIAIFNQLSGINALLYYLNDIFEMAGFSKLSGSFQAVIIGMTNLIFTMIALLVIDKIGRKKLLLIGSVGTAFSLFGVAFIFLSQSYQSLLIFLLIAFIAFFAFSQGAVIWVYLAEIFPTSIRAKGQSLGSLTHWVMCALVSWCFPVVASISKGFPFLFFASMMLVQFFVVLKYYLETKGVSLEELQKKLIF